MTQAVADRQIAGAFQAAASARADLDWNDREAHAAAVLASTRGIEACDVYLGGDGLRPYLLVRSGPTVTIARGERAVGREPPLLAQCRAGAFGPVASGSARVDGASVVLHSIDCSDGLLERTDVPVAALVSLTNVARYRAIRYPLNIGRLVQWVRFTHAARGYAIDSALDCGGDISALAESVRAVSPGVVGVSVNFGELDRLAQFLGELRRLEPRPRLLVGNVLAAWAGEAVREVCDGFDTTLSQSYGESVVEGACGHQSQRNELNTPAPPSSLVLPDERLLVETLLADGQLALESTFGCQYGQCTFCPRDHRGDAWSQGDEAEGAAIVRRYGKLAAEVDPEQPRVLSFVDEEAFGAAGRRIDGGPPPIIDLVAAAAHAGLRSEIYTRLEQIFDRRKPGEWNADRLAQLKRIGPHLVRVFVGVESGSWSQLRRYGKGQTPGRIVDALRAGSLLGIPFEFGFITFDPLLTPEELVENLDFLARNDVVLDPQPRLSIADVVALTLEERLPDAATGSPVYMRVAYMATELELLSTSRYAHRLKRTHPALVGSYEPSFARYGYTFADPRIGSIASRCRVWTEGTFESMYRIRLSLRSQTGSRVEREVIERHRTATFALLVELAMEYLPEQAAALRALRPQLRDRRSVAARWESGSSWLEALWSWCSEPMAGAGLPASFDLANLERRRSA